jgi:hypothetical protein
MRGILKTFGIRLTAIGNRRQRQQFRDQLSSPRETDPALAVIIDQVLPSHEAICSAAAGLWVTGRAEIHETPSTRVHELVSALVQITKDQ